MLVTTKTEIMTVFTNAKILILKLITTSNVNGARV